MSDFVTQEYAWQPQATQQLLISCPIFEVFFGGARGGGKTDGMLGDWLQHSGQYGEAAVGVFFRRAFVNLSEVIARSSQIFTKLGARWRGDQATWVMPNGARLLFRHLDRDTDADNYQGHNYTRVYVEEITQFPSPKPINKLKATLRSARGVAVGFRATGNPGGAGHGWVKERYINPAPKGFQVLKEEFENPFTKEKLYLERTFIPSRLEDNRLLMENDPLYVARLASAGSKQLVQAWLLGEWDIIDGAFFDEFSSAVHILPHSIIGKVPQSALVFRSHDWGFAKPFSTGWYAVADGTWADIPRGAMVKISEWYGIANDGSPNVGIRLDSGPVGAGIRRRDLELKEQYGLHVRYGVADPSIFARDGGPSISEQMSKEGCHWQRADNKRMPGWQQMRRRLIGTDGKPLLYFSEACHDTIRTITTLQHDERNAEDLDSDGEDHAADETRYACMARPWTIDGDSGTLPAEFREPWKPTFNQIVDSIRRKRVSSSR